MAATHYGARDWMFGYSANVTLSNGNTEPAYLAGVVLSDSAGVEYGTGNPLPVTATVTGTGAFNLTQTGGNVLTADDAAAGTTVPVPVGGVYNTTLPSYSALDRTQWQSDSAGNLRARMIGAATSGSDTVANNAIASVTVTTDTTNTSLRPLSVVMNTFDGTQWIRTRSNTVANGGAALSEAGPYVLGRATADAQIKGSGGFIHTISIAPLTATPTAGLLTVYNSLTETGTVVYSEWIFATTPGHTVVLDVPCGTGIYVGFDGTLANVQVTVSYR